MAWICMTVAGFFGSAQLEAFPSYVDVTTLNGANGFSINGKLAGHQLGYSVHKAGDVNGDGFGDVIVAPKNHYEVAVIFGKASGFPKDLELVAPGVLDGIHGFTIGLNGAETELAVSGGGDVNGDGVDDMVVGSPKFNNNDGRVCVIFGKKNTPFPAFLQVAQLFGPNGFILNSATAGSQLGFSVTIAKDINGDGIDEVVAGAPNDFGVYNGDPSDLDGRAYIVMGKTSFPISLSAANLAGYGFSFAKEQNLKDNQGGPDPINMRLGWSVSGTGDVNDDGFNDLLIGAPRQHGFFPSDFGNAYTGMTYVLFGSAGLPNASVQDIFIQGWTEQDELGRSVGEAGDVNGDGIDDLLTGTPLGGYDINFGIFGYTALLLGNQGLSQNNLEVDPYSNFPDFTNGVLIDSSMMAEKSGRSVSGLGDIDGDGLDDIIIGSPETYQDNNGTWKGEAWVVFGRNTPYPIGNSVVLPFIDTWKTVPGFGARIGAIANMGWSVSGAGDINGDGLGDIIIGAPEADTPTKTQGGRAYVIFGQLPDPGDLDGDGNVDLFVQGQHGGNYVAAALMKDGKYLGVKKTLVILPSADEKVVAVNDFDLDGQVDLVTQNGAVVNVRKGPGYAVSSTFNLNPNIFNNIGPLIVASGNVMGGQSKGKIGYPDLIVRSSALNIGGGSSTNYRVYINQGDGTFAGTAQAFYTLANGNYLVGCGRFLDLDKPIIPNQYYSNVLLQKLNSPGKDVYANKVSSLNTPGQFLTFMPASSVLGVGNFMGLTKQYELVGTNASAVTIGIAPALSGYTLSTGEQVVGPK